MARIRTVKPEFWTDEVVGECSVRARLLFLATWNFSDDHGGLDRSAKQLKAQAFPYDSVDCEPLVQELLTHGLLIEYESEGKKYLHIKGFRKHQKVEKPAKPKVPLYDESLSIPRLLPDSSPSGSGNSPASSGSSLGRESKGREGKGEESARGVPDFPSPNGLDQATWTRWLAYRQKIKKPIKPPSMEAAQKSLAAFGSDQAAVVEQSIAQGWQGLFALKRNGNGTRHADEPALTWRPPPDEELEPHAPK